MKATVLFFFFGLIFAADMVTRQAIGNVEGNLGQFDFTYSTISSDIYNEDVSVTSYYAYDFQPNIMVRVPTGSNSDGFIYGDPVPLTQTLLDSFCNLISSSGVENTPNAEGFQLYSNGYQLSYLWAGNDLTSAQQNVVRGQTADQLADNNAVLRGGVSCVSYQSGSTTVNRRRFVPFVEFPTYTLHSANPVDGQPGRSLPPCRMGDYALGSGHDDYVCVTCGIGYECPFELGSSTSPRNQCLGDTDYQDEEGQTSCKKCFGRVIFDLTLFVNTGCDWICSEGLQCPVIPDEHHVPYPCDDGYYSDESVTNQVKLCKPVPEGYTVVKAQEGVYNYTAEMLNVDISICPIGHMCPSWNTVEKCTGQMYQDEEGQTECKLCEMFTIPDPNDHSEEPANIGCLLTCQPYEVMINNQCYPGCGCNKEDLGNDFNWIVPSTVAVNGSIAYQYLDNGGYVVRECLKESNETHAWNGNCTWGEHIYHENPFVQSTVSFDMLYDFTGISLETLKTYKYYIQRVFLRMFPEISYRFDVMGLHHSATAETHLTNTEKSMLFMRADIFGDRFLEARYPLEWLEDYQERLSAMFHEVFGEMFTNAQVIPLRHEQHLNNPDDSCVGYPYCEYDRRTNCTYAVGDCHNYDQRVNIIQGEYYEYHGVAENGDCPWGGDKGYFVRKCSAIPYQEEWAILDPTGMWDRPNENHQNPANTDHQWVSVTYQFHGLPHTFFTNNITYALPSIFLKHASRSTLYDFFMSPPYELNEWVPNLNVEDTEMDSSGINVRVEIDNGDYDAVLADMTTCTEGGEYNVCAQIESDLAEFNTRFHVPYYVTATEFDQL